MSENDDKKQDSAIQEGVGKTVEVLTGDSSCEKTIIKETVVEETIIEEVTVTTRKKKGTAKKDSSSKSAPVPQEGDVVATGVIATDEIVTSSEVIAAEAITSEENTTTYVMQETALGDAEKETTNDRGTDYGIDGDVKAGEPKNAGKIKRKRGGFINNLLIALIAILAFIIVFLNVFVLCPIKQDSMTPTILDGERVLLLRSKRVKNGEIFVFDGGEKDEDGNSINLIKRALASGGDRILFAVSGEMPFGTDTRVVNLYRDTGEGFVLLEEDYISEPMYLFRMPQTEFCLVYTMEGDTVDEAAAADYIITVPDGYFYALGDNRNESNDSRSFGFIQKKMIIGCMKVKLKKDSFAEKILRVLYWDRISGGCNIFVWNRMFA